MIITVDLVRSVLHAAVADVVADQLAGDAVRGVAALELRRVVAARHVLHTGDYSVNTNLCLKLYSRHQCSGPCCALHCVTFISVQVALKPLAPTALSAR